MNDDTTKPDGWEPVEATQARSSKTDQQEAQSSAQRVGFCQDCGRPLTQETLRAVGTGVFCEPCLTARVGSSTASSGYAAVPAYAAAPTQSAVPGEPSPILAAILGFIPGVGAMYNGQFAKGIVHLIIFVVLVSLSENVNGIFGLFVAGWMFYMAFEAYHTATARRDGLPLPNAFGFNDIGERMGFGKTWGGMGSVRPGAVTPVPNAPPPVSSNPQPVYPPTNQVPVGTAPDWVGYVPPTAFGGYATSQGATAASVTAPISAQATRDTGTASTSYAETYTGANYPYGGTFAPSTSIPEVPARRIPTAAFWLIGLGVLILVANLLPDWKLTGQWWPPVFFAGLAVWLFVRRLRLGVRPVCILRWPVILLVLAVMLGLHAAYVPVTIALTASVLLIAFGALLLLERTAGASPVYAPPIDAYPVAPGVVNPPSENAPGRAAWADPSVEVPGNDPDHPKVGE
ncbi:MAG: hypothetical protein WB439_05440 [Acidobacteriaceae bacterium]